MNGTSYGGGTAVGLSEALAERIREATEHYRLETPKKNAPFRAPQIIRGFEPPKRSDGEAEQPFVIVCPANGEINNEGIQRVQVGIVVGIRSEDFEASDWLLSTAHRIIQSLRERPTLDSRYVLEYPLKWDMMFVQPYPLWQLEMLTEWVIPAPVMLPDEGVI